MKIASFETLVVGNPPPHHGGRYFVFVRLETDDGIVGWGEVYAATFSPSVIEAMVADVCERHVVDHDPHRIETMWRNVYGRGYTLRPDLSLVSVLSGIEIACWDIVGKAAGKPIHELLGGRVHDRLRTYTYLYPPDLDEDIYDTSGFYADANASAEAAAACVAEGFTAIKLDPMGGYSAFDPRQPALASLDLAVEMCSKIRDAVGSQADICFGTHGQFTVSGAKRLARLLEPFDPLWFEEPTPPEAPTEMARVASATSIPISTGERLVTKYEFAAVVAAGAASILQPNVARCGGLLEAKKIAALAEVHHAQVAPHLYNGPIGAAANIQLAACSPNFLILESIRRMDGFHAELLTRPIEWHDGDVVVSDEPGLGTAVNEEVARAHPWTGDPLHLEMTEAPLGHRDR